MHDRQTALSSRRESGISVEGAGEQCGEDLELGDRGGGGARARPRVRRRRLTAARWRERRAVEGLGARERVIMASRAVRRNPFNSANINTPIDITYILQS